MSWYDYIPGVAAYNAVDNATGGKASDVLFGGLGKSASINDYVANNPQQGAIDGMLGQRAAQVDPSQQAQFRAQQMQLAQQLQRVASGQQAGAGELAAQRQVQNALAAQQAMARMSRGGGAGMAQLGAARNAANIGLSGAGLSQQAALQDQANAMGQLGNVLGQGRGQDLSLAGQNAQFANERYGQNLGALTSLNGQQLGAAAQSMGATLGQQGIAGGLLGTAGTLLAHSDENLKTDISDAGGDIDSMLDNLVAKTYRYKDESKFGEGPRAGIMAQDLQKSKAGAALVTRTADGLAFDVSKAVSAALASTARLNERLRKVEARG